MKVTSRQPGWYLGALLTGGVVLALAGCNAGGGEGLAPVVGKVTVDGKPLTTGSVSLRPDGSKGNKSQHQPTGAIDPQGNFEVLVPPARKGAPLGWYKVVVTALDDPQPGKPLKSFIDMKYADENNTPLKVEVIASPEPGRYDFKLTR
ncbi:MAG: hypothetical protein L0Z62_45135 [Gemmataceae bacterium]|nr:hypothetical protein [Gemmataceae bacterium]